MVRMLNGASEEFLADPASSTPIHKFWYRNAPGHCADGNQIILIPGTINTVLDFIIIGLVSLM